MARPRAGGRREPHASYRVEVEHRAEKALAKLPRDVGRRVVNKINSLAANPRPSGCEPLEGEPGLCRVRVGDYRIIYQIRDDVLLVLVVRIGPRGDVYRHLRG
jgi:mRNA interferase RelE/StbE